MMHPPGVAVCQVSPLYSLEVNGGDGGGFCDGLGLFLNHSRITLESTINSTISVSFTTIYPVHLNPYTHVHSTLSLLYALHAPLHPVYIHTPPSEKSNTTAADHTAFPQVCRRTPGSRRRPSRSVGGSLLGSAASPSRVGLADSEPRTCGASMRIMYGATVTPYSKDGGQTCVVTKAYRSAPTHFAVSDAVAGYRFFWSLEGPGGAARPPHLRDATRPSSHLVGGRCPPLPPPLHFFPPDVLICFSTLPQKEEELIVERSQLPVPHRGRFASCELANPAQRRSAALGSVLPSSLPTAELVGHPATAAPSLSSSSAPGSAHPSPIAASSIARPSHSRSSSPSSSTSASSVRLPVRCRRTSDLPPCFRHSRPPSADARPAAAQLTASLPHSLLGVLRRRISTSQPAIAPSPRVSAPPVPTSAPPVAASAPARVNLVEHNNTRAIHRQSCRYRKAWRIPPERRLEYLLHANAPSRTASRPYPETKLPRAPQSYQNKGMSMQSNAPPCRDKLPHHTGVPSSARALTPTHTGPFPAPNRATTPSNPHTGATFGAHLTKSPRGLSPGPSPQQFTGATALEDDRRRQEDLARRPSPNPQLAVVQSLIGTSLPSANTSKNAPPEPSQMSAPLEKVARALVIPHQSAVTGDAMQTSPVSLSSFGSADSTTAPTATAMQATTGPMMQIQEGATQQPQQQQQHAPVPHHQPIAPNPHTGDHPSNRAFTFPGPLPLENDPRAPQRQMSLPGYQNGPKSPSAKRHKCPYCSTDFTRHHNLKSHLLTHSQEKPYECPTCQARFRRLHDLKRHTKLHTGERPHTCPKCGRKFARGDALARHNKGQGGCAGRRSSFGLDDDMMDGRGDEGMDGIVYHPEHDGEGDDDDEGGRRVSEPARKRQNTGNSTQGSYRQHSSTYPPLAVNRSQLGQSAFQSPYPAPSSNLVNHPTNISPNLAPGSMSSLHYQAREANMFSQGGMTESPKPLSPGQDQHRMNGPDGNMPRSPNMHANFARNAGRGSSPMGMAPPLANAPHLPALPGLAPGMMVKQGSQDRKPNGPSMLQHQQVPGSGSQPGSISSHGASSGGSMREVMGSGPDMWQYVRDVEARMARMKEDHEKSLNTLQTEVTTLRAQLAQQHGQNSQQ
ncbi:hypothetical protein P280DRAFT_477746 [Massarina eburnea CBS 473.64]|uniref:C2H2-type domain-containing protein n=1 Tax=Massarina eburnea CBS 473.64 TaxID=1395130 RepID=A0A6A6SD87_9PLEO|nr:hypothetical protein P280DRAFT_477746 [Massarina eburnea CBS 473.64]